MTEVFKYAQYAILFWNITRLQPLEHINLNMPKQWFAFQSACNSFIFKAKCSLSTHADNGIIDQKQMTTPLYVICITLSQGCQEIPNDVHLYKSSTSDIASTGCSFMPVMPWTFSPLKPRHYMMSMKDCPNTLIHFIVIMIFPFRIHWAFYL